MRLYILRFFIMLLPGLVFLNSETVQCAEQKNDSIIQLPQPKEKGEDTLEEVLWERHSVREYKDQELNWEQIGQLLWAAQGINRPGTPYRTAPSAGALYPLELYVLLPDGLFHYLPQKHVLEKKNSEDLRRTLSAAALGQEPISDAPCVFLICAVYSRTAVKYGERAHRYVLLEAGHAAQNILLQAVALNLGTVPIGAFIDAKVKVNLSLPKKYEPIYILPVGFPEN